MMLRKLGPRQKIGFLIKKVCKGNQTMKFDQLIIYCMGTIFLEKSFSKCGEETRPFSKKSKLNISLDQ